MAKKKVDLKKRLRITEVHPQSQFFQFQENLKGREVKIGRDGIKREEEGFHFGWFHLKKAALPQAICEKLFHGPVFIYGLKLENF